MIFILEGKTMDLKEKIIDGVKAKITVDNVSKIAGALKDLF